MKTAIDLLVSDFIILKGVRYTFYSNLPFTAQMCLAPTTSTKCTVKNKFLRSRKSKDGFIDSKGGCSAYEFR